jgi:hypothetical protein
VKEGYFHDKHPDKLNIYQDSSASLRIMMGEENPARSAGTANLRSVSGNGGGQSCGHCAGPPQTQHNA